MTSDSAQPAGGNDGDDLFATIAQTFAERPGVTYGRMFRGPGLSVDGKLFAFVGTENRLIVNLPRERCEAEVASGRALPLAMPGRGPMKEWVEVTSAASNSWPGLVEDALAYVRTLPARKKRTPASRT